MAVTRQDSPRTALMMLEDAAQVARSGFACMFSTADEYEAALIAERRAEGRYGASRVWPVATFLGCSLAAAGAVLWML
jgi:hypothetical protein